MWLRLCALSSTSSCQQSSLSLFICQIWIALLLWGCWELQFSFVLFSLLFLFKGFSFSLCALVCLHHLVSCLTLLSTRIYWLRLSLPFYLQSEPSLSFMFHLECRQHSSRQHSIGRRSHTSLWWHQESTCRGRNIEGPELSLVEHLLPGCINPFHTTW